MTAWLPKPSGTRAAVHRREWYCIGLASGSKFPAHQGMHFFLYCGGGGI